MRRLLRTAAALAVGLVAGGLVAAVVLVLGAAVFWLFIFGDDGNPAWAETALIAVAMAAAALTAIAIAYTAWTQTEAPSPAKAEEGAQR